jgi:hypothetical protein
MTSSQALVANLSALLMALTAAGLLLRRRARLCRSFLAYLLIVTVGTLLAVWIPDPFFTQWFWIGKKAVYAVARSLIALEIVLLTFSGLPRARRRAEFLLGLVLAAHLVVAWLPGSAPAYPYLTALGVVAPRGGAASLWLFVAAMLIAAWHRAPVHAFHRQLLLTFTLYLGTETWLLGLIGVAADSRPAYLAAYSYLEALDPLAFAVTAGFWTWAAWRAEPVTALSPAVATRLQPWAA